MLKTAHIRSLDSFSRRMLRILCAALHCPLSLALCIKGESVVKSVVQEEATGCGIASVANILGKTYSEMKAVANAMGIHAADKLLWSDTQYVRYILSSAGVKTSDKETPFESWEALPDLALLSIKYHQEEGENFWHWVVFKRVNGQPFVLDSANYLPTNIRQDSYAMQPKWFIEVENA
ncbi:MAG: hypothetical protein LM517_09020 [Nitrosomonas sp.]|nr:hypothetical protein [Nitrosomonas sp.]